MQQASEVAKKCTQSEPLRDRDGGPHRVGRRFVRCVESGALNHSRNITVAFRTLPNKQQVTRSDSAGKIGDRDLMAAGGVNFGMDSMVMAAAFYNLGSCRQHTRN